MTDDMPQVPTFASELREALERISRADSAATLDTIVGELARVLGADWVLAARHAAGGDLLPLALWKDGSVQQAVPERLPPLPFTSSSDSPVETLGGSDGKAPADHPLMGNSAEIYAAAHTLRDRTGQAVGLLAACFPSTPTDTDAVRAALLAVAGTAAAFFHEASAVAEPIATSEFQRLLDQASAGIVVTDTNGVNRYVSPRAAAMFGRSRDDMEGHSAFEFILPEDLERSQSILGAMMTGDDVSGAEVRFARPDGSEVLTLLDAVTLSGPDGTTHSLLAVARDVTKQRERERANARLRNLLETAINQTPVAVVVADAPDVTIRLANPAALAIRGGSPEGLVDIGLDVHPERWQVRWPDGRLVPPRELPLSKAVLDGVETRNQELIIRRDDGEDRWISVDTTPVRDETGHVTAALAIFQDITERRRVAAALQAQERMLSQARRVANMGSFYYTPATGEVVWSEELFRIYGRDPALGSPTQEEAGAYTYPVEDQGRLGVSMSEALEEGVPVELAYRIRRDDGEVRDVHVLAEWTLDPGGQPVSFHGTVRDITDEVRAQRERELLQEQLRQAQKMEAIGRLAGGVAHDFNNILTGISGICEMIQDGLTPDAPIRDDIAEIAAAAARAADITSQLLAFSRKQVVQPRVLDLNEVVAAAQKLLRRLIGEDVELRLDLSPGAAAVHIDPTQVDQILVNLATNSRDAMPNGGSLTLRTSLERLPETAEDQPSGDFVRLDIVDEGRGMDDDVRARIFEPFFSTKEHGKGTGLGLSTVYGIVRQAGGFIEVESTPGTGTTFIIRFPHAADRDLAVAREPRPYSEVRGTETVLLVEDEPMVRKLAKRVLERAGFRVLEAQDGADAIRHGETDEPIDLLITDVVMPFMNGRELHDALRARRPSLRAVYMSGYPEDVIAHRGVLEEGICFVAKPFLPAQLLEKVRAALDEP